MFNRRMEFDCSMCLTAVQIKCHTSYGDVCKDKCKNNISHVIT